jgi:hypothetical protein
LKTRWRSRFETLRQRLVLTPEEKRLIVFVFIAFILGLATKHYRDTHPPAKLDQKHPHSRAERGSLSPSSSSAKAPPE